MAEVKDKLVRLETLKLVKDHLEDELTDHVEDDDVHVTSEDREKWNKKGLTVTCIDQMLEFKLD